MCVCICQDYLYNTSVVADHPPDGRCDVGRHCLCCCACSLRRGNVCFYQLKAFIYPLTSLTNKLVKIIKTAEHFINKTIYLHNCSFTGASTRFSEKT